MFKVETDVGEWFYVYMKGWNKENMYIAAQGK